MQFQGLNDLFRHLRLIAVRSNNKAFQKNLCGSRSFVCAPKSIIRRSKCKTSTTAKCWDISGDLQKLNNTSSSFTLIFATLSVIQSFITPRLCIHELNLSPLLLTSKFEKFPYQGCLKNQPCSTYLNQSNIYIYIYIYKYVIYDLFLIVLHTTSSSTIFKWGER